MCHDRVITVNFRYTLWTSIFPPTLGGQENSRFYIDLRNASTMELAHSVYQQSLWSSYHAR